MTEKGVDLQDDDDHADAAHKARNHRVGHQADVVADPEHAEGDLKDPGQYHRGEDQADIAGQTREKAGEHHHHRPRGARDIGRCAAEQCGEETHEDRAVHTGHGAESRGHAKGERQGNGHHAGGQAAVNITAQVAQIEA